MSHYFSIICHICDLAFVIYIILYAMIFILLFKLFFEIHLDEAV